jgi:hypothetical protein
MERDFTMSVKEENIGDLQSILAEEEEEVVVDDPKNENDNSEGEPDEESDGESDGNSDGEEEEEILTEEEEVFAKELKFPEIKTKYPELFKDFPHLRHTFFHAKEYREIFPTVEEAKESASDTATLRSLESSLANGETADVMGVLNSFKEVGDDVVENFASNFLPALQKVDQNLYYSTITPELVTFVRKLYDTGVRDENDNFKNAALVASKHFFGVPEVASGEQDINTSRKEKPKVDKELEAERNDFRNERYSSFYNDILQDSDSGLMASIQDGLDPKDVMNDAVKDLISERVMKEINKTLQSDTNHAKRMDGLWKKASDSNFNRESKPKITAAYLEAAKGIMPSIRSKVRSSVLGVRERHSEKLGGVRKRKEPASTSGGGGRQSSRSHSNGGGKKIDWAKTTDADYLSDNITYQGE